MAKDKDSKASEQDEDDVTERQVREAKRKDPGAKRFSNQPKIKSKMPEGKK